MQFAELHLQRLAGLQHGLGDPLQHRVTRNQGAHPGRKLPFADLAHLEPKAPQKTPQAELHVAHLGLQLLARDQQRPNLLGRADLQCTGRNQPMQSSWAMPRASLRSLLTIIAESTALTWRVSSSAASKPALTRAA